jgi:hypothetical protein
MAARSFTAAALTGAIALALANCSEQATVPVEQGYGPQPTLPAPKSTWIPTINVATATGWPAGESQKRRRASP